MSLLTGQNRNITRFLDKNLPSASTFYQSNQDIDDNSWSAWVDADTYVASPWINVSGFKWIAINVRRYLSSNDVNSIDLEGSFTDQAFSNHVRILDIYNPISGKKLQEIPSRLAPPSVIDFPYTHVLVNIENCEEVRLRYKDDAAHDGTDPAKRIDINMRLTGGDALEEVSNGKILDISRKLVRNEDNLYDRENVIERFKVDTTTGAIQGASTSAWSDFIKCKPGTYYTRNSSGGANSSDFGVAFYDESKTFIEGIAAQGIVHNARRFKTPDTAHFMAMNVKIPPDYNGIDNMCIVEGVFMKNYPSYEDGYLSVLQDIKEYVSISKPSLEKKMTPYISNAGINVYDGAYTGHYVWAMYENRLFVWWRGSYYLSTNGWDGDFEQVDISSIHGGTLTWALFVKDHDDGVTRLVLRFSDDKLFHSHADGTNFNNWAESSVWGLPNTLNPDDATTKVFNGRTRPKYYMPDGSSNNLNFLNGCSYQDRIRLSGPGSFQQGVHDVLFIGTYSGFHTPASAFMSIDGKDFYCVYQYGINKTAAESTAKDVITTSLEGTIPADMQVQSRTNIIPDVGNKEPVNLFEFGTALDVVAISPDAEGTKTKVVTSAPHGLSSHNTVRFISSVDQNSNNWLNPSAYADMLNNTAVATWPGDTPPGGNGKFYRVVVIDDTSFHIHEAIGNPHENLQCVHIHGVDYTQQGIVLTTGDTPSDCNYTLLFTGMTSDATWPDSRNKIHSDFGQMHLTADINGSARRGIGFWMDDTHFVFPSDEVAIQRSVTLPSGRTQKIPMRSTGIYRGRIDQLDNFAECDNVLNIYGRMLFFKEVGNAMIAQDNSRNLYVSYDKGMSWQHVGRLRYIYANFFGYNTHKTQIAIGTSGLDRTVIEITQNNR